MWDYKELSSQSIIKTCKNLRYFDIYTGEQLEPGPHPEDSFLTKHYFNTQKKIIESLLDVKYIMLHGLYEVLPARSSAEWKKLNKIAFETKKIGPASREGFEFWLDIYYQLIVNEIIT